MLRVVDRRVMAARSMMRNFRLGRVTTGYVCAVLATFLLASIVQSVRVLLALSAAGANIPGSVWLRTVAHDLYGFVFEAAFYSYPALIAIGLVIALPAAAAVCRFLKWPRSITYALAGATAIAAILLTVQHEFVGATLFAGARGPVGFVLQLLAGAGGGAVFAWVTRTSPARTSTGRREARTPRGDAMRLGDP